MTSGKKSEYPPKTNHIERYFTTLTGSQTQLTLELTRNGSHGRIAIENKDRILGHPSVDVSMHRAQFVRLRDDLNILLGAEKV